MWRKTIIIQLLVALALLPAAAHAVGTFAAAGDSERHAHESMVVDCGQFDPDHCIDFESCTSGSHASCDAQSKSAPMAQAMVDSPPRQVYASPPAEHYLSHHAEFLLRPPRIT